MSDAKAWLRGGPRDEHDYPCVRPSILVCAQWECQKLERCQYEKPPKRHGPAKVVKVIRRTTTGERDE